MHESLGSLCHWYRFEYAVQREQIHCHGIAKLKNDPGLYELTETDMKGYLASKYLQTAKERFLNKYWLKSIKTI